MSVEDPAPALASTLTLPLPPLEFRRLAGPEDPAEYDNPSGAPLYPFLPAEAYEAILDFGCGCGRTARQLMLQRPVPGRYVGCDVHKGMVEWCTTNLTSRRPNFTFVHHDVYHPVANPGADKPRGLPLPAESGAFTLVHAWSVFSHLVESQVEFYLRHVRRTLKPTGIFLSTWFLFDKRDFPMLQPFQNALYINEDDPTNAVVYDRQWVSNLFEQLDLVLYAAFPPRIRGYQWVLLASPARPGIRRIRLPDDLAPRGRL